MREIKMQKPVTIVIIDSKAFEDDLISHNGFRSINYFEHLLPHLARDRMLESLRLSIAEYHSKGSQSYYCTVSEPIVNAVGKWIARKQIKPEEVEILFVSDDPKVNGRRVSYNEDGVLMPGWPFGYFSLREVGER